MQFKYYLGYFFNQTDSNSKFLFKKDKRMEPNSLKN